MVRYLARSANLLNALLFAGLITLVVFVVLPLFHMKTGSVLPGLHVKADVQEAALPAEPATPPVLDYAAGGEQNLFHPERRIPPEKKVQETLPRPELVLYGTVVSNGSSLAFIEDKKTPKTTEGRGKRQSVIKRGDTVSGFVLREVREDRIVLVRGDDIMTVHLVEAGKKREGDAGPVKAAGAQPSGQARTTPPSSTAAAAPARATQATWTMKSGPQQILSSPAPALAPKQTGRGRIYTGQ